MELCPLTNLLCQEDHFFLLPRYVWISFILFFALGTYYRGLNIAWNRHVVNEVSRRVFKVGLQFKLEYVLLHMKVWRTTLVSKWFQRFHASTFDLFFDSNLDSILRILAKSWSDVTKFWDYLQISYKKSKICLKSNPKPMKVHVETC